MTQKIYYTVKCDKCGELCSTSFDACPSCGEPLSKPAQTKRLFQKNTEGFNYLKILISANIALFIFTLIPGYLIKNALNSSFLFMPAPNSWVVMMVGAATLDEALRGGELWRLVSAAYLHGNVIHIAFNLLWLKEMYSYFNIFFKRAWFPVFYVITGVAGNLAAVLTDGSVIGSSGAVFGIIGAIIAQARRTHSPYGFMIYTVLGKWAVVMLILGFLMPNVSNGAHIGGLVAGLALGYLYNPRKMAVPIIKDSMMIIAGLVSAYAIYQTLYRLVWLVVVYN